MNDKANKKLEGEGSYTATRRYNAGVTDHVRSANVSELGKKAAKALEGPEGKALKEAEKAGKRGPRAVSAGRQGGKSAGRR